MTTEILNVPWQRERDWLGYAGLLPFVGATLVILLDTDPTRAWLAVDAMRYYAAVIASFLGAIHWGVAVDQDATRQARLRWGVTPALLAWVLLLAPPAVSLVAFGLLFAAILVVDLRLLPLLDTRFRRLRIVLTTVVVGSLWVTALILPEVTL